MIGSRLRHYEVTAKLGEGGMGEVYQATDTKLGREVAIKVLPEAFTADPERLARFEREARMLAALDHPNIAAIYDLEEVDAKRLLVMQLAPGVDLATRIAPGPLPLDEALPIALQIARALEAAHERGIVHRDLKPANVMVAPDGSVKVLDFGLAKAWEEELSIPEADLSASPTLTAQMTAAGTILGTAAYMSPEQARGQPTDRRSDVWSFGVVLYEVLRGERLFASHTTSDTLARVLTAAPDWDRLEAELPPAIVTLLRRCLERDVRRRLQAIGEARILLESEIESPQPGEGRARPAGGRARWAARALGLAGAALAGLALGFVLRGLDESASPRARHTVAPLVGTTYHPTGSLALALSPDGETLAFVAAGDEGWHLYVKEAGLAEPYPIPGTEGAGNPFFSPDGEWIAYYDGTHLMKVALRGGNPVVVAECDQNRGGAWTPDGFIIMVPSTTAGLWRVPEGGGRPEQITLLDEERGERTHRWPALLPGGRTAIFTSDTFATTEFYDDARIEAVDLSSGERKVLLEDASMARFLAGGTLVYAQGGTLFGVPFDPETVEVTGEPRVLLEGVLTLIASGAAQFALSDSGRLAYVPGAKNAGRMSLSWADREGRLETLKGPETGYFQVSLSPSGDRAAVVTATRDAQDIWILDLARGTRTRLTFGGTNTNPVWSRDGRYVTYAATESESDSQLFRRRADGSDETEPLWKSDTAVFPQDYHPGRELLAVDLIEGLDGELRFLDLEAEGGPRLLDESIAGAYMGNFSPDGRWIAYVAGQHNVFVEPFPFGDGRWQISTAVSREPRWSADGTELFFRGPGMLYRVAIDTREGFRAGEPEHIVSGAAGALFNHVYAPSPDGRRFLMVHPPHGARTDWRIHLHLDWPSELGESLRP